MFQAYCYALDHHFEFRTVGVHNYLTILGYCNALLVRRAHGLSFFFPSQADVGPFLPQRFSPPDYAWEHAARCYKQKAIEEVGRALYGSAEDPLDAQAEPSARQALRSDNFEESEGASTWRAKREEFGLSAEAQTADYVAGQVDVTSHMATYYPPKGALRQKEPRQSSRPPRKVHWAQDQAQPSTTPQGSSSSSTWWQGGWSQQWTANDGDDRKSGVLNPPTRRVEGDGLTKQRRWIHAVFRCTSIMLPARSVSELTAHFLVQSCALWPHQATFSPFGRACSRNSSSCSLVWTRAIRLTCLSSKNACRHSSKHIVG